MLEASSSCEGIWSLKCFFNIAISILIVLVTGKTLPSRQVRYFSGFDLISYGLITLENNLVLEPIISVSLFASLSTILRSFTSFFILAHLLSTFFFFWLYAGKYDHTVSMCYMQLLYSANFCALIFDDICDILVLN